MQTNPNKALPSLFSAALVALFFLTHPAAYAQYCPFKPADCPDKDYANADLVADSADRILNPLVPQEISMEYRLRQLTGDFVRRLAAQQHWEPPVELNEGGSAGFRKPNDDILPYLLRPPHWCTITWEVIINKDSLIAWSDWFSHLMERMQAQVEQYRQQAGSSSGLQKVGKDINDLQQEKLSRQLQFRDATVLLLQFEFNADRTEGIESKPAGDCTIPGCALARRYYTAEPDITDAVHSFTHSRNMALVLVGPWNTKLTANGFEGFYESPFYRDKTARDHTSPKKNPCDQVRGISLYLSGNKAAIQKILSGSALTPLQQWIAVQ
jgi:hypothetical protein